MVQCEECINERYRETCADGKFYAESREVPSVQEKVSIVDGMAELQSLDKPTQITT